MNKTIPNTLILYYFCCFNSVKLINKTRHHMSIPNPKPNPKPNPNPNPKP